MNALARLAVLALFMLALGCGRVGAPLPPLVRIPAPVQDLVVTQNGNTLTLSWTTPSRYVGGDPATDLAATEIFRDGVRIETIQARVAGQRQSYELPANDPVDTRMTFNVRAVTTRGEVSVSNMASISLVEPPGAVQMLTATFDQRRIHLEWKRPAYNGDLIFIVARNDGVPEKVISGDSVDDRNYEAGRKYTYWVTAARAAGEGVGPVRGTDRVSTEVTAKDDTPPASPTGVQVSALTDGATFVAWSSNTEEDLAGYHLKRGSGAEGPFTVVHEGLLTTNSYFDRSYSPGLYYAVFAVDESGNENMKSVAVPGP